MFPISIVIWGVLLMFFGLGLQGEEPEIAQKTRLTFVGIGFIILLFGFYLLFATL